VRFPDFFIVGAPKCGTTALYTYLREHPGVFMPELKEPHFFCHDLRFPQRSAVRDRDVYLKLFAGASDNTLLGEASASYLYSEVAIPEILKVNQRAKFIVILRNPVDMAYSFHSQLLSNLTEDISHFPTAWQAQEARRYGRNLPKHCIEPKFLQYKLVCSFSSQISRLMRVAPRDQVFVCIFEEFICEPKRIFASMLRFLDLAAADRVSFPQVNANKQYRSMLLNRLLRRPPGPLDKLYSPLKRFANALGLRPRDLLERANSRLVARPPLDSRVRAQLQAEFAPDIERLEQLLDHDLERWRDGARAEVSSDRVAPE
jgi:Sulfotransferase domain